MADGALIAVVDGPNKRLTEAIEAAIEEDATPPLIITAQGAIEGMAMITELAHARGRRPDLLVIDLGLAGGAGGDLVARARRADALAGCPILAIGNAAPAGAARLLPNVFTLPPLREYPDFVRLTGLVRELLGA